MKLPVLVLLTGLLVSLTRSPFAFAELHLAAGGGLAMGSGSAHIGLSTFAPHLSGEAGYGFDLGQVAAFYEYDFMAVDAGGTAELKFLGLLVRADFPNLSGFFLEGRIGGTKTDAAGVSSDSVLGYGFGAGMRFPIAERIDLRVRGGYRSLPFERGNLSLSRNMFDLGALFCWAFF